ncbi:hypothetical protein HK104_005449 [Borealophlyctis nickersoniae]|nr:hypothetical protein HK104_005449 [Borealophlyctis nickersoniae]
MFETILFLILSCLLSTCAVAVAYHAVRWTSNLVSVKNTFQERFQALSKALFSSSSPTTKQPTPSSSSSPTTKQTIRVHVEQAFHPFVAGPKNSQLNRIQAESGAQIHIPPMVATSSDKNLNEILIVGGRAAVLDAEERVKAIYDRVQRTTGTLAITVKKRQHRFIIEGSALQELWNKTGCFVELPASADPSEMITIRGPDYMLSTAVQVVLEKSNSVLIEDIDVVSLLPHTTDPHHFLRYLYTKERNSLKTIESAHSSTIHQQTSAAGTPILEIQAKSKAEVDAARLALYNLLKEWGQTLCVGAVHIPRDLHKFVIGRGGQNITTMKAKVDWAGRLVDVVVPPENEESDEVIIVVKRVVPAAVAKADGSVAASDKEASELIEKVKEDVIAEASVLAGIINQTVNIDSKYHGHLIGAAGAALKDLLAPYNNAVSVRFPHAAVKEGKEGKDTKEASPNAIVVKGPKKEVEEVVEKINKRVAEWRHVEVMSSFSAPSDKKSSSSLSSTSASKKAADPPLPPSSSTLPSSRFSAVSPSTQSLEEFWTRHEEMMDSIAALPLDDLLAGLSRAIHWLDTIPTAPQDSWEDECSSFSPRLARSSYRLYKTHSRPSLSPAQDVNRATDTVKEQREREQREKKQREKEQREKEQREKEQREKEHRERELREKEQREKEQREKEQREKEQREKEQREKEQREKEQREKDQAEKEQREKDLKSSAEAGQPTVPSAFGGTGAPQQSNFAFGAASTDVEVADIMTPETLMREIGDMYTLIVLRGSNAGAGLEMGQTQNLVEGGAGGPGMDTYHELFPTAAVPPDADAVTEAWKDDEFGIGEEDSLRMQVHRASPQPAPPTLVFDQATGRWIGNDEESADVFGEIEDLSSGAGSRRSSAEEEQPPVADSGKEKGGKKGMERVEADAWKKGVDVVDAQKDHAAVEAWFESLFYNGKKDF